ncbi:PREDICTED: protein espinas-like [Priapulus caudatus]|uniref:Protein espinas-like n=1 Tax=Priapulus caudatus TaxID=37621 RepID=A0ABM1F4P8_PRICU|nr:PREDICTED: protein espinas-like [Priapulus caudatus]
MNQLPNHKVPRLDSPGEKYREKQLMVQLPRQDLSEAYCRYLEAGSRRAFIDFVMVRNEMALDIAYVKDTLPTDMDCRKCQGALQAGDLAVFAPKFGEQVAWHPACFVCHRCDELLVDLTYCVKDGNLFCERHYAETIKPRCAACDEGCDAVYMYGIRMTDADTDAT